MTVQHLWERIKRRFPHIGLVEALTLLNYAQEEFARDTRALKKTVEIQSTGATATYALPSDCFEILAIHHDPDGTAGSNHAAILPGPTLIERAVVSQEGYYVPSGHADIVTWYLTDEGTLRIGTTDAEAGFSKWTTGVFSLSYVALPAALTTLSDTPEIPSFYHLALFERASETLWDDVGNDKGAAKAFAKWRDAIKRAKRDMQRGGQAGPWVVKLHEI